MPNKGFTLLELLLSLSIMAVIAAICFGVIHMGVRAWEKGESRVADNQRLRIIPELMRRQLASAAIPKILRQEHQFRYLTGTARSLEFLSRVAIISRQDDGGVYVNYRVRANPAGINTLEFYEMDLLRLRQLGGILPPLTDEDFHPLLSGWQSLTFAYLNPNPKPASAGEDTWLEEWDSVVRQGIPRAVRITAQPRPGDAPLSWIVPLAARSNDQ